MSRRKQARPIRHLDDEEGGPVGSLLDGQEEDIEASTTNTGAGKFHSSLIWCQLVNVSLPNRMMIASSKTYGVFMQLFNKQKKKSSLCVWNEKMRGAGGVEKARVPS